MYDGLNTYWSHSQGVYAWNLEKHRSLVYVAGTLGLWSHGAENGKWLEYRVSGLTAPAAHRVVVVWLEHYRVSGLKLYGGY